MAKMTVLEMTQDILSDMESDSVNSINDTSEGLEVAQIIKSTYFNIIDGKDYPWQNELFQLTGLGLPTKPTHMQIPEGIESIVFVKYNLRKSTDTRDYYKTLTYKTPEEFLIILEKRNSAASTVTVVTDYSGTSLNIINNMAPTYYTSFDENYIVFDSFDSGVDSSLTSAKSQGYGRRAATFTLTDNFTPDLPVQMFSYLLSEAKATCFSTIKQVTNAKAEQHSISQRRRMSQKAWKLNGGIRYPNYGRK